MKVVHVFNSVSLSGPEMLVIPALKSAPWLEEVWLLKEVRATEKTDFEDYCEKNKLPLRIFPVKKRLDWLSIFQLRTALARLSVVLSGTSVIIHCHDAKASLYIWLSLLGVGKKTIRTVTTHHGAMVRPDWRARLYERIYSLLARWKTDLMFSVSESEYRLLRERGWSQKRLVLHRNGIDRPPLRWEEKRNSCLLQELRFVIVARLSQEKNHARLFAVLSEFDRIAATPWRLDIVGTGPLETKLKTLRNSLGFENRIQFLGFIPEAWRIMQNYHLLLLFSLGEGLPVAVLEAAWRSTPVFASAVGGIPEVLGGERGELFNLRMSDKEIAERLHSYACDTDRQKRHAERLFEFVKSEFSEQRWLGELQRNYLSLLRRSE